MTLMPTIAPAMLIAVSAVVARGQGPDAGSVILDLEQQLAQAWVEGDRLRALYTAIARPGAVTLPEDLLASTQAA